MRLKRAAVGLVIGGVLVPCHGALGQDDVQRVTLGEALEAFAQHSLELRIARSESEETAGLARQLRAYANPAFSLVREDLGYSGEDYWETTAGVVQRFEWPGRTTARARVAAHTIGGAAARFQADSMRLAFAVREAYVRSWFAEEVERTMARAAAVVRTVARAAELRLEEGDISAYEARRLRLERVRAEQEMAAAALDARSARRGLAALIAPDAGVHEVGPSEWMEGVPPRVQTQFALDALGGRPDLEAAVRNLDAARAREAVAITGWVPDPTVSVGFKDQSDGFSGGALSVNLPLPLFDRGTGQRRGAAAGVSAASHRLDLRRRQAEIDLVAAADRYASARTQLVAVGDDLFADADALLASATAAYREGEATLVELLDAARTFREVRLSALSLRATTWIAYYDLLRAMGGSPEDGR